MCIYTHTHIYIYFASERKKNTQKNKNPFQQVKSHFWLVHGQWSLTHVTLEKGRPQPEGQCVDFAPFHPVCVGFSGGTSGKEPACQYKIHNEMWVWSLGQEDPLQKEMATHSRILDGESNGQRSLAGSQGHQEWDTAEATEHACTVYAVGVHTPPLGVVGQVH